MTMQTYHPRRFKVQMRVDLHARDRSNRPFLLGVIWRTVNQQDKLATIEIAFTRITRENPTREYRIAEEWPLGSAVRPLLNEKRRAKLPGSRGAR